MNYINRLTQILNDEKALYLELTELANEKQQAIIANDIERLVDSITKEEELIQDIELAEKERRQAIIGLCTDLNISEKDLSFTRLREYMDENTGRYLDEVKRSLLDILERLQEINETNRLLIEQSLSINEFNMNLLTQARSVQSTYTKEGSGRLNVDAKLIDKKA